MSGMLPHLEQRERLIDKKLIDKKLGELQDDNTEERLINLAVTGNTLEKKTSDNWCEKERYKETWKQISEELYHYGKQNDL